MKRPIDITQLKFLAARADSEGLSQKARERLAWLVYYAEHDSSVQDTCVQFDLNPVTLYRLLQRFDINDLSTLEDRSRRPHTIHRRIQPDTAAIVREYAQKFPHLSRDKIALLLSIECGIHLSPSTIIRILQQPGEPVTTAHAEAAPVHACILCRWRLHWKGLKRTLIITSVLANIALIALFLLTMMQESDRESLRVKASLLQSDDVDIYTLIPLP